MRRRRLDSARRPGLGPLADLQARWCGALDALYLAALDTADVAERAQILARADQLSECDLDLRRARRELLGLTTAAPPGL